MEAIVLLIGLLFFGVVLFINQQQRQERTAAAWRRLAAEKGLTFTPGGFLSAPTLAGQIDGVGVGATIVQHKHGKSSVSYVQVATVPALPVPAGFGMSPEGLGTAIVKMAGGQDVQIGDSFVDDRARIRGQNEADIQALFEDALLRQACMTLFASSRYNRIADGQVVLEKRAWNGDEIYALLSQALDTAVALDQARVRPWQHLATKHDLQLEVGRQNITAAGTVDGFVVEARGVLQPGRTVIKVRLPEAVPAGLKVVSGDKAGAVALGDPILDGMISASGAPPETLRALLRGDALRGELLAVLHAFPSSRVSGGVVEMVLPVGSTMALEERVRDACRLARALSEQAKKARSSGAIAQGAQRVRT